MREPARQISQSIFVFFIALFVCGSSANGQQKEGKKSDEKNSTKIQVDISDLEKKKKPRTIDGRVASESMLPSNTIAWVSVPDADSMKKALEGTQFGAMMNDPNVRPFVDDLVRQLRGYLDDQNIRFGMSLEDIENVHTGEICLAGILKKPTEGAVEGASPEHGILLLIDVNENQDKADELMGKIAIELTSREATEEKLEIEGVKSSKWAFKKPQGLSQRQYAFHAVVDGWMIASDNEIVFRDTIRSVSNKAKEAKSDAAVAAGKRTFADTESFGKVFELCEFKKEGFESHVRWFVEPFGYVQLAQAISDAQASTAGSRNNIAEKFEEEGFSAIKGVGGVVSFATGKHEAAHRTFVYAPPVVEGEARYERAAAMLDFRNRANTQLDPPSWVPADAAGFVTFTWDLKKALNNVGYIVDKTSGTEGSFERALDSLENDPQGPMVDVRDLVTKFNDQVSVCSVTNFPIDDDSERIVFGIKVVGDEAMVEDAIYRLLRNDASVVDFNGTRVMVIDTAEVEGPEFEFDSEFDDEFDDGSGDDDDQEDDEPKPAKPLFEKRVVVVKNGFMLIGNNLEQVQAILTSMPDSPGTELTKAADYVRINESLQELAGEDAPSFRHFGRMDRTVRTNYEMMRTGRMAESKTLLAQLLNRAYTEEDSPEDFVREQQVDGTRMPADFEGQVAKYFGPTGLVVHSLDEGWLMTGVMLAKQEAKVEKKTAKANDKKDSVKKDSEDELAADDKK